MEQILEMAKELGHAIQQDERFIRYAKARLANDSDKDLQAAIGNFNIIRVPHADRMNVNE